MEKVNKELLNKLKTAFVRNGEIIIEEEDLIEFEKNSSEFYFSLYTADNEHRAIRISERIRCDLRQFTSGNKAALFFTGNIAMDEVAEVIDGLNDKTDEIIWGSLDKEDAEYGSLEVRMLFYKK